MSLSPKGEKVAVITLGCPKNQVDSEYIMGYLYENGFQIVHDPDGADIVIVNTCAFLGEAVQESIGEIKEIAHSKKSLGIKKLVVTGCLVERFKSKLREFIPEVDQIFGIDQLPNLIQIFYEGRDSIPPFTQRFIGGSCLPKYNPVWTPYQYLKISEGCDRKCSFCIIPKIRGKMRSRKIEDIVCDAKNWLDLGKKELIVVSQDPTSYGFDIYGKGNHFVTLLKKLDSLSGDFWLRLLYLHPSGITKELIEFLSSSQHIVPYLDVPIQHISSRILKLMQRTGGRRAVNRAISLIRDKLPDWYLRTEIIVGFPSETDQEFSDLLKFVEDVSFERLAVFAFSSEPEASASKFLEQVPVQVINDRYEVARIVADSLANKAQERLVGKSMNVLIEGVEDGVKYGRTYYDAPEIDFTVRVKMNKFKNGEFIRCRIIGLDNEFNLEAV